MALTKAQLVDLNSNELILDLDADTSLHSSTDDQIDIKIGGADDFRFTANTFTALAGSSIVVPDSGLTLGSTAVTSTAAELNLLDGVSGLVQADLTKLAAIDATATELNFIDGGATIGTTAVADGDGIIHNDGGTMKVTTAATFKTYFQEGISQAYDDFTIGDAAVLITTSAGNITIDAAANDSDIIFKGTDGGADKVFMTIDGSAGGDLFLTGGLIDLKNDGSAVSQIKFYCESSNAHAQTLIGAPHAQSATNTLTLPDGADGVLLSTTSTATLTNKTLTSPVINTGTFGTSILPVSADGTTLGSASKEFSDLFLADASTIQFGADQDVTLTHSHDAGLILKHTATADNKPITFILATGETDIAANDVLGEIHFQAPDEGTGTDAILVAASIAAVSEGDFSSSNNATKLSFKTAASESATEKMSLSSAGLLTVSGDVTVGDDLNLTTDSAVINFGADSDTTLTHTDGAGLTLNSTNKLMFNDASQFIQGSSATVLSIAATDEIDLTATTVDLNGTLNVSGVATFQAAPVFPDGSIAVADLDIDGATDIGAAIVDADLFIVDDGAGGTNRKVTAARLKTYAGFNADAAQIFNESGADVDFRIESDGNDSMFKVDAGNNRVGIGTGTPGGDFEVKLATNVRFVVDDTQDSQVTLKAIQDNGTKNAMRIVCDNLNVETNTGSNTNVNRLRVAADGEISINDDGAETGATVFKVKGALNNTPAIFEHRNSSGSQTMILFRDGAVETCGTIGIAPANNTVSYNTSSDYRLKENESTITDGITRVKSLKPYKFNWKKNPSADKVDGFFAHEVSSVVPEAIHGEKDAFEIYKEHQEMPDGKSVGDFKLDEDGNKIPEYQGIDQAKLVPVLTAALKEAIAKIETLETKVQALEDA